MKKITTVEIENFQSHWKTKVNFDNFSVIVGPTDSGKSAIIRAIKWCLYNSPDGVEFVRQGETTAAVVVSFDDGTSVKRVKGKGVNFYDLTDENGVTIHLESFGSGSVTDVLNFHGMREIMFAGSSRALNICDQLSGPFFLSESSIERAMMIGDIANTKVPDRAIKNVVSEIKERKATKKMYTEQLAETKANLKKYAFLPLLEKNLFDLDEVAKRVNENMVKKNELIKLKLSYEKLNQSLAKVESVIILEDNIELGIAHMDNVLAIHKNIANLKKNIAQYESELKKKERLDNITDSISQEELESCIGYLDFCLELSKKYIELKALIQRYNTQQKRRVNIEPITNLDIGSVIEDLDLCKQQMVNIDKLKSHIKSYTAGLLNVKNCDANISKVQDQYEESLRDYKSMLEQNPHCPVCMSEITQDKINHIEEYM